MPKSDVTEFIKEACERFKESYDAESGNRELGKRDSLYENGEQWEQKERAERANRPCVTVNKLAGTIKQITGDVRQNRPRIKVRPADSVSDPMIAEIMTGLE